MSLVYFWKKKKSTFSITSNIQILMYLIKIFEVTGKKEREEMENSLSSWHIINQNMKTVRC